MNERRKKSKYIIFALVLLFISACAAPQALRYIPPPAETAQKILSVALPFHEQASPREQLTQMAKTLLGFDLFSASTILANQLAFYNLPSNTQQDTLTPPTTQATAPPSAQDIHPIEETCQTVAALQNTEGANKQIYIDNDTSYTINIEELIRTPHNFQLAADAPSILIVHTHTTESYTPEGASQYDTSASTRTLDKTQNVVRVGEEIAQTLRENGINVLHDTTINDHPSYNGSYTKTLGIIEWYLQNYPSIRMVIDVHRDAMTRSDGTKLKLATTANGTKAAQVMLVIGTNEGGLPHENWKENLCFALHLQDRLTKTYPGLARPINLRKERFNQHATPASMILEVGTDGNTLSEAIAAGRCFAEALTSLIQAN